MGRRWKEGGEGASVRAAALVTRPGLPSCSISLGRSRARGSIFSPPLERRNENRACRISPPPPVPCIPRTCSLSSLCVWTTAIADQISSRAAKYEQSAVIVHPQLQEKPFRCLSRAGRREDVRESCLSFRYSASLPQPLTFSTLSIPFSP